MSFSPKLPPSVRRLFQLSPSRARLLREMDDEVRAHLAMRIDELRSLGMSEVDAVAEALRRFGDSAEYRAYAERRAAREARARGLREWSDDWTHDVRFAFRQFGRNAGFTALAVLTLALGIGANTAIFSVVYRLLIAPLPYADGNRIVRLVLTDGNNILGPRPEMVRAWRDRAHTIENVAAVSVDALYLQDFGDTPDTIAAWVTRNYLGLLGLHPELGRGFTAEDERAGAAPVAMISHRKWQREFAGDDVVGATIRVPDIDARSYTIVGVMPPEMSIPMTHGRGVNDDLRQAAPAIWLPASLDSIATDQVFAKLSPGVSATDASRELQAIAASERAKPLTLGTFRTANPMRARAMRAQDFVNPRAMQTVQVLFVAVAALLLVACANVANLLMSRAWMRRREFAVRAALGAGRARIARLVLTESVLLAIAGGVAGVGVAWLTLQVILSLKPATLSELSGVKLDTAVLICSAGISVLTGMLFGSAPALFAGARPTGELLRSEMRTATGATAARRMRDALIVIEIAVSLTLLVGASLLVRTFAALQRVPLGFEPSGLVSADVLLMFPPNWDVAAITARRNDLRARLHAIPGVTDAGFGMMPGLGWHSFGLETEGTGEPRSIGEYSVSFISPNYFRLAGTRLLEGRAPDSLSGSVQTQEIVVSRTLARRLAPESDGRAIGVRLHSKDVPPGMGQSYAVVGIAEDIQMPGRRSSVSELALYGPPPPRIATPILLRTALPAHRVVAAVRRSVADLDRELRGMTKLPFGAVVRSVTVGDRYLNESLAPTRFAMALMVAFSVVALVLSAVGLYGLIAYSVTQRTREIGVRVALGANARSVERLVVGGGLRLTTVGLVLGVAGAAASTRLIAGLLYGVRPTDPASFAAIALLVLIIALVACYVPARRAIRIDPVEALRTE